MHTPISERRRLVARWREQRSLSMPAYALSIGVSPSTFWRWAQDTEHPTPAAFVELTVPAKQHPPSQLFAVGLERAQRPDLRLVFDAPPPAA